MRWRCDAEFPPQRSFQPPHFGFAAFDHLFPPNQMTPASREPGDLRVGRRPDQRYGVAFRCQNGVGVPIDSFAAQYPAYMFPCQRFDASLAAQHA